MNFGQMTSEIAAWLDRDDLEDSIHFAINAAIRRIESEHNFQYMYRVTTLSASNGRLSLPERFKEPDYLVYLASPRVLLRQVSPRYGASLEDTGTPEVYWLGVVTGSTTEYIHIRPVPSDGSDFELGYYQFSEELSNDGDTHWLLEHEPMVVLYGTLLALAPRSFEEARIPALNDEYQLFYQSAIKHDILRRSIGSPQKVQPGIPVI